MQPKLGAYLGVSWSYMVLKGPPVDNPLHLLSTFPTSLPRASPDSSPPTLFNHNPKEVVRLFSGANWGVSWSYLDVLGALWGYLLSTFSTVQEHHPTLPHKRHSITIQSCQKCGTRKTPKAPKARGRTIKHQVHLHHLKSFSCAVTLRIPL